MKECLLDYNFNEISDIISSLGEKSFRAKQIYSALNLGLDIDEISTIKKEFREILKEKYIGQPVKIKTSLKSKDGTEKFLFLLSDGNIIEGVLMRYKYGNTICVSTQVGCRMNCAFCASGLSGLIRNLSAGEILGEVIAVNHYLGGGLDDKRNITNVVLMGSGEPLDNYDNTVKFLRLISNEHGLNVSPRNISLSTSGIVPNMIKLAEEDLPINLTVSLHSPFDGERQNIMPIAKKYSIKEILDACSYYFDKTGRRYIFEYVLIKGKNDGERHLNELVKLLKGRPCHLNIIRLNEVKEKALLSVSDKYAYSFAEKLTEQGISATVRRRLGDDIEGACGQLRRKFIKGEVNG